MPDARQLEMKFAGGLVKHLGLQMYSGAVPSIAELIANAYDADAASVDVRIPFGQPISDDLVIEVHDGGHGMTFDEVNAAYLVLGRDRRRNGGDYTAGGRKVMGRKGLGKLAGFGIANVVEIWTVRDGNLTAFKMDYDAITRHGEAGFVEAYHPELLYDRPVESADPIQNGTLVRLLRLQLKKAIPEDGFRESMTRRFAVLSDSFRVSINDTPLVRSKADFEFRFPKDAELATEDIPGAGQVRWWVGFMPKPITVEEARGIAVIARGKLAQTPFFFNLSGGVEGQHGLQYMTGEVHADFLDAEADLIATDRSSVRWDDPKSAALLEWGRLKIKMLLKQWLEGRTEKKVRKLRDHTPYLARIEKFPDREKKELTSAIMKLASIETIEDERLSELVDFLIKAYENEHFMALIRALNSADQNSQEEIFRIVAEWDVLEAIATAQVVHGRVEIIRKFRHLIESKAPEKPDMQDFLMARPWLIDPSWQVLQHEKALDTVLVKQFELPDPDADGNKRLDFFCLADSRRAVVVEVKRSGDLVGRQELRQLEDYVDYLTDWSQQSNDPKFAREINGMFIYGRLKPDAEELKDRLEKDGIYIRSWEGLLYTAENLHRDFLDVVKARAPRDDPRIKNLEDDGGDFNSPYAPNPKP